MLVGMIVSPAASATFGVLVSMVVIVRVAMPAAASAFVRMGVRVVVPMVMGVAVIMRMVVSAPAAIAVMMVRVGIDQRRGQPPLECD